MVVGARLTASQEANRRRVLAALQLPSAETGGPLSGEWCQGRHVFFAADVAVVLTVSADPFCIPLGLHAATVSTLLRKVLAV